ncbi:DUF2141 domain-containing protein [Dyadobacter frigoris]|uniref:DUF2141 domain-containing protein n=1 Tax=Dyadobacter frigoris TaxID=2576211 RepID=A0A4U6D147_9BACT|nr:DUF2141 domain-containing protein [Dyadobacter frigoris]TKT87504.1 DUF2141 domain-containing protein [Dyadobacter frigoris]GLU52242.1 hypothetical protein Dfri01_17030 [Dyadobacter frigoris]
MKLIYTATFAFFLFSSFVLSINSKQTLLISNLENKTGKLFIGWYSSKETFAGKNPEFKKEVDVRNLSEISIPFDDIPDGKYGISIYLDENNNGKMDLNFLGIPKEKYGFSNNVFPATRAANFQETAFEIQGKSKIIPIRLK